MLSTGPLGDEEVRKRGRAGERVIELGTARVYAREVLWLACSVERDAHIGDTWFSSADLVLMLFLYFCHNYSELKTNFTETQTIWKAEAPDIILMAAHLKKRITLLSMCPMVDGTCQ